MWQDDAGAPVLLDSAEGPIKIGPWPNQDELPRWASLEGRGRTGRTRRKHGRSSSKRGSRDGLPFVVLPRLGCYYKDYEVTQTYRA